MALLYVRNSADTDWILVNSSEGNKIYDADGDTKIQVEESADEDLIRFDAGGVEYMVIGGAYEVSVGGAAHITLDLASTTNTDSSAVVFSDVDDYQHQIISRGNSHATNANELQIHSRNAGYMMYFREDGEITTPLNPAFLATMTSDVTNFSGTITMVWDGTPAMNRGGHLDEVGAKTTFTAPVDGLYQFNAQVYCTNLDKSAAWYKIAHVYSNGSIIQWWDAAEELANDTFYTFRQSVAIDMEASDIVYVQIGQSGGAAQTDVDASYCFWSGYLVG